VPFITQLSALKHCRVSTGQGKLEKIREFVWSWKNIIFEKSGKSLVK